jgi:hypothetical protein
MARLGVKVHPSGLELSDSYASTRTESWVAGTRFCRNVFDHRGRCVASKPNEVSRVFQDPSNRSLLGCTATLRHRNLAKAKVFD